jgi:hypothetical protein
MDDVAEVETHTKIDASFSPAGHRQYVGQAVALDRSEPAVDS